MVFWCVFLAHTRNVPLNSAETILIYISELKIVSGLLSYKMSQESTNEMLIEPWDLQYEPFIAGALRTDHTE